MTDRYDAIVVGAGHNGLVCAALLARTGKQVLVLEANDQVGGAAVTREFADGYSVSAALCSQGTETEASFRRQGHGDYRAQ